MALLARTGVGRDINRHRYTRAEIDAALQRPVVQGLLGLIRLRNQHPAFDGRFVLQESAPQVLAMRWENGAHVAELQVDFRELSHRLRASGDGGLLELPLG